MYLENMAIQRIEFSESFLKDSEFMGGDGFSIADISAFTIVSELSSRVDWSAKPLLTKWYRNIYRRQAVERGVGAFD
jgi:GST-like protein